MPDVCIDITGKSVLWGFIYQIWLSTSFIWLFKHLLEKTTIITPMNVAIQNFNGMKGFDELLIRLS